jgi:hypothetical protein
MTKNNHRWYVLFTLLMLFLSMTSGQTKTPPPITQCAQEPVVYTGSSQPDKYFYDGKLPHAVGVHHYQALRANRKHPSGLGNVGWTYNHQPYIAYWNGTFYVEYLSGLVEEHNPPTRTLIMTSSDGMNWNDPIVVFPEYTLPEIKEQEVIPAGTKAVMHQRMGFYVSPNGKLLALGFYGYAATPRHSPNTGNGLGRVIREIENDGSMGPIYFIRYNRHAGWNESNTKYPFYKASKGKEFLVACDSLLANKLVTLQWWEEDRGKDSFFTMDPSQVPDGDYFSKNMVTSGGAGKALSFFHRPDGVTVALWKNQYSALSPDNGNTWTKIAKNKTLWTCGAKTWGQRTDDGRYAIVHDHSATRRNRFPMVAIVGEDGHTFDSMFCLTGEVSPMRYQGIHKNTGPQYFRGIVEGNGNPPGNEMWITYSMNKEDIWVSRTRVPITGSVSEEVNDSFDNINSVQNLDLWNLYIYKWGAISIEKENKSHNKYLVLKDEDPYDYPIAERVFPKGEVKEINFKFQVSKIVQGHALEIEVQDQHGGRALKLRADRNWLSFDFNKIEAKPVRIQPDEWYNVILSINCKTKRYTVTVNGKSQGEEIEFADKVENIERIIFRTGPFRGYVPWEIASTGAPSQAGLDSEDLPGADEKVPACIYFIDDLKTKQE